MKVGVVAVVILLWCFAMSLFIQRWGGKNHPHYRRHCHLHRHRHHHDHHHRPDHHHGHDDDHQMESKSPLFLYVAHTAAHSPLQVLIDVIIINYQQHQ